MAYEVPDLPYDYDALEPHIDEATMRVHHDKHHQAYVDKANAALEGTEWADKDVEEVLRNLSQPDDKQGPVRNNGGGHYNHSLFWQMLSPDGGGEPEGDLADAINEKFGSFDDFKEEFKNAGVGAASAPAGPGWSTTAPGSRSPRPQPGLARSPTARRRCSAATSGSTPTTSSTRTSARTTSTRSGTSSTGTTSPSASRLRGTDASSMSRLRVPRPAVLGALVALTALLSAVGVGSAAETITADAVCCTFSKAEFQSNEGERPLYSGNGLDFHNVSARGRGSDGAKLFRSADIKGGTSPVEGAQYLSAGSYPFECTLHFGMEATLVIGSDGTPKARPKVAAVILRQTLDRVRQTGRLKVRLRTVTGALGVIATARGAGSVLARQGRINLGRNATRVVGLQLTRRGRATLAGRRSARISLTLKVPYGSAASVSRTLRGG